MKENRLVLMLGLAGFIVMADNWVVSPILPAIAKSLSVPTESAGILIAAYMLPFGLFQLIFGPLADRYGKSRIVLGTLALFTLATALCAAGATLTGLTIYRAFTGVFAAATMPISLALIGDAVPMEKRQQAIGSFMGIAFLGQALSMGIGFGFMTAHSTLLTVATEFAEKARGAAMSLVTFCFMLGGALGTGVGAKLIASSSYNTFYAVYAAGLGLLALLAIPALRSVSAGPMSAERAAA